MVCSGDTLIYGIEMSLEDVAIYTLKYLKRCKSKKIDKKKIEELEEAINEEDVSIQDLYIIFEMINLPISIHRAPCCLFDRDCFSSVYLGIELCSNDLISRFNGYTFTTIEEYEEFLTQGLEKAKKYMDNNKDKINKYLKKFVSLEKNIPKFYTLPNDCFSCS